MRVYAAFADLLGVDDKYEASLVGIYSTEEKAREAIKDAPESGYVHEFTVDAPPKR